jgi:phosphoserine phosphatase
MKDLEKILVATLTGMSVEDFKAEASKWTEAARDPRWKRPYTDLTYQPMQDVLRYLRDNDYKTYIVTGGGQDFVRVYAERVYGIPPEQVVGTAGSTKYGYAKNGKPFLTKEPKLVLNDNDAGKPEGINLMIGRRPYAAFGNSTGDRQMLEYTEAGDGRRLTMLVLHDDAAALVVVPIGILSSPIAVRFSATRANPVAATYVGSEVCAGCRRAEADLWRCSQHKHAMAHATNRSVLGDSLRAAPRRLNARRQARTRAEKTYDRCAMLLTTAFCSLLDRSLSNLMKSDMTLTSTLPIQPNARCILKQELAP